MKSPFVVFYAWQSDLPNGATRDLIRAALEAAAHRINQDPASPYEVQVDQDTKGVPGLCDIPATILTKIAAADAMLCDLSYVATTAGVAKEDRDGVRYCSNPNVLFELGYAFRAVGPERLICVMNESYGPVAEQIFDLAHRRYPIGYRWPTDAGTKTDVRDELSREIELAIRGILSLGTRHGVVNESRAADLRQQFEQSVRENSFHGLMRRVGAIAISVVPAPGHRIAHETLKRQHFPPPTGPGEIGWDTELRAKSVIAVAKHDSDRYGVAELREDGVMFGADSWVLDPHYHPTKDKLVVPSTATESTIIWSVAKYLEVLHRVEAPLPWSVGVSLLEIADYWFLVSNTETSRTPIRATDIITDLVVVTSCSDVGEFEKTARTLRPAIDYIWREFGFSGSRHYSSDGHWSSR